jgi:D-alanine transaminase
MSLPTGTCYLNGRWMPLADATISVLDRGFIFGDGVYEVVPVDTIDLDSRKVRAPFRAAEHFARLARSLAAIGIANPYSEAHWLDLTAQLIERHPWARQLVYIQITRGVFKRDHAFPQGIAPTVFAMSSEWPAIPAEVFTQGVSVVTHPDERWLHCDIKSTSLLGNVLMKQYAVEHGATETVMLRDGYLTEGSSTNVFVVKNGTIAAPVKSHLMLPGITYDAALAVAQAHGAKLDLRPIAEAELRAADELWLSSSGREVMPVTQLDGAAVGSGAPGPMFARMRNWFAAAKREDAGLWLKRRAAAPSGAGAAIATRVA